MSWFNLPKKMADELTRSLGLDENQEAIAYYGLQLVWTYILNLLAIGLLSVLTGTLAQALAGGLAGAIVRLFAGGAHSNSPWRCALVGAVVLTAIGRMAIFLSAFGAMILPYFMVLSTLVVLVAIWLLAPVDSPAKPIIEIRQRRKLRSRAVGVVLVIFVLEAIFIIKYGQSGFSVAFAVCMCLLWQGFSLTGTGHRALHRLDSFFTLRRKEVV
ncbi:MAG TPA: accessory gene regulator B family protein [Spirochaetia bacterium]|nr:accessory gene regulator B family protein [Spirochaetia bacterium]